MTAQKTVREMSRSNLRDTLRTQRSEDILRCVMGWAEDMRGRTWGTPTVVTHDMLDDISDAVAVLRGRVGK